MAESHLPTVGWDAVSDEGWMLECSCGVWYGPSLLLLEVAEMFDNHMRALGILVDGVLLDTLEKDI